MLGKFKSWPLAKKVPIGDQEKVDMIGEILRSHLESIKKLRKALDPIVGMCSYYRDRDPDHIEVKIPLGLLRKALKVYQDEDPQVDLLGNS